MKVKGKKWNWSQLWKRNAVVAAIALFVCVAVYLNWTYDQDASAQAGKTLGEAALVGSETNDPLLSGDGNEVVIEGGDDTQTGTNFSSSYFASARLNRQQARDTALSQLQEAASGDEADQTLKDQANQAIQTMASYTTTEAEIENMVVAKGYTDCVAFIGQDGVSLAVASPDGGITDADTARIVDVVGQIAGYTTEQINIIPVE